MLKVSFNPHIINGRPENKGFYTKGWQNVEVTPEEFADNIKTGMAYACQLMEEDPAKLGEKATGQPGPYRNRDHFLACDALSLDIDGGGMTIDDALADPFIKCYATILYPTKRHLKEPPGVHRFRVIFALPRTLTDRCEFETALLNLQIRFDGDRSIRDGARIFNGNAGCIPIILGGALDHAALSELINVPKDDDEYAQAWLGSRSVLAEERFDPDMPVRLPSGQWAPLSALPVKYGVSLCCPYHADKEHSALTVLNRDQTSKGIHCIVCQKTWWPKDRVLPVHDFTAFDRATKADLKTTTRYLTPPPIKGGLNLVKSPMGTGKTEVLRDILAPHPNVLVISHRRLLCNDLSRRLNVVDYQEHPYGSLDFKRLVLCVDSLRRVPVRRIRYPVVVLDESEQILKHFFGGTMEDRDPYGTFMLFSEIIRAAEIVIAQDADLGWITYNTLGRLKQPIHFTVNEFQQEQEIEVFGDNQPREMIADLIHNLAAGMRVFVAANSKATVKMIEALVERRVPDVPFITITADTKAEAKVLAFSADPKVQALKYRLIITSPALGSGVDLTFPGNAREVDIVYGFLGTGSSDHLDFSQQLGRVRHPGAIKLWATPRTFNFDLNEDVIRQDMVSGEAFQRAVRGMKDFRPVLDTADPFIDLATLVTVENRASMNALRRHITDLKARQGYRLRYHDCDPTSDLWKAGEEYLTEGWGISVDKRRKALMAAPTLNDEAYHDLLEKIERGKPVSEAENLARERTMMERFYKTELTDSLIDMDDHGRFKEKVELYEAVVGHKEGLIHHHPDHLRFYATHSEKVVAIYGILAMVGLMVDGVIQPTITIAGPDLDGFIAYMTANKPTVEKVLGVEVRADIAEKPMAQVNAILKLIGLRVIGSSRKRSNGKRQRRYHFNGSLPAMMAVVERRRK